MTKLNNSYFDKTQKNKLWQCKNSHCEKTQIVTKLKNSCFDKTQKFKLWQPKTKILTKHKNWKCDKSKTQIVIKTKLWENSKTQVVTKRKNSNCDKTQNSNRDKTQKLKSWQLHFWQNLKECFGENNFTPRQPMSCTLGSVLRSCDVFFFSLFISVQGFLCLRPLKGTARYMILP